MKTGASLTSHTGKTGQDREDSHPVLSVVIPAYNEAEELPLTLLSLRQSLESISKEVEIIVVDNNSSDHTAEVAKENGADQVVFEPVNQIARARNAGGAVAKGLFLVFLDADTRIEPELLEKAIELLEKDYVGGGALIQFEGEVNQVGKRGLGLWSYVSRTSNLAAGSFIFCRKDGFDAIGGFDEKLYAGEEIRFSRRMKEWGRDRKMPFTIINDPPVKTSARKLEWYSGAQVFGWMIFMMIFPMAVRWRSLCGFWYQRPDTKISIDEERDKNPAV